MDVREKLIELIESARYWGASTSEEIADSLLANGVTIQRWHPASEPPRMSGEYIVMLCGFEIPTSLWFSKIRKGWYEYGDDDYDYRHEDVTHWMPLPEPPENDHV